MKNNKTTYLQKIYVQWKYFINFFNLSFSSYASCANLNYGDSWQINE